MLDDAVRWMTATCERATRTRGMVPGQAMWSARPVIRTKPLLIAAVMTVATAGSPSARIAGDGVLLRTDPHTPLKPFDALDDVGRGSVSRAVYEDARAQKTFDILHISYASNGSGGSAVPGILIQPKRLGGRRWPAIVYNRGGTGDVGRLDDLAVVEMYLLAKAGFVVIASDYRFHGALSKRDEWGGLDVEDVMSLFPLLRSQPVVDADRLFMLGVSRGGTMTYLALKRGAPVKAAAVIGAPSDLEALAVSRPDLLYGDRTYDGWANVWVDFAHRAAEHYRERSAVNWAKQIIVPLLMLHAKEDRMVPLDQSLRMAAALQDAGREYELSVYQNDGHALSHRRNERNREIIAWFNGHRPK